MFVTSCKIIKKPVSSPKIAQVSDSPSPSTSPSPSPSPSSSPSVSQFALQPPQVADGKTSNAGTKMTSVTEGKYTGFASSDNKFGIAFPNGWEGYENKSANNTMVYYFTKPSTYTADKCFAVATTVANTYNITSSQYSAFLKGFDENYFKSFSSVKPYGTDGNVKIGSNKTGFRHRVSVTSSTENYISDEVVFATTSDVYMLMFLSDPSTYTRTVKDFDIAISSFSISNK